jgi:hypothetical protein
MIGEKIIVIFEKYKKTHLCSILTQIGMYKNTLYSI